VAQGGLKMRPLMGAALQMGDDGHNRCKALTALLLQALAPALIETAVAAATPAAAAAGQAAARFMSQVSPRALGLG